MGEKVITLTSSMATINLPKNPSQGSNPFIGTDVYWTEPHPPNFQGDANPATCKHEWYRDTSVVYTSNPPQYKHMCRLCGITKFVSAQPATTSKWQRVV